MTRPTRASRSRLPYRDELLSLVSERGYERSEEPFRLSSGALSHDYVDMRRAVSNGEDLLLAAKAVIAAIEASGVGFQAIGGMTMGADPVAHAVALVSGALWFSVRKAEKDHGAKRRIEGAEIAPDMPVVVFEDTVSTGRSILDALDVVEEAGGRVVMALTLLDRGDDAAQLFARRGVDYLSLLTYRDLGIEPIRSGANDEAAAAT